MVLPNKKIVNKVLQDGDYVPVIIYQTSISTAQNVDSVGTH